MFASLISKAAMIGLKVAASKAAPIVVTKTAAGLAVKALTTTEKGLFGATTIMGGKMLYDSRKKANNPAALRMRAAEIESKAKEAEENKAAEAIKAQAKKMQKLAIDAISSGKISQEEVARIATEALLVTNA